MKPLVAALEGVEQLTLSLGLPAVPGDRVRLKSREVKYPSKPVLSGTGAISVPTLDRGSLPPLKGGEPLKSKSEGRSRGTEVDRISGCEVLSLRASLLCTLPLACSLKCRSTYSPIPFVVTTSRDAWQAYRRLGGVAFGIIEWSELIAGFHHGRANPVSLSKWCEYKQLRPTWRLTRDEAIGWLASCSGSATACEASVGAVLAAWGVELVRVAYDAEVPV